MRYRNPLKRLLLIGLSAGLLSLVGWWLFMPGATAPVSPSVSLHPVGDQPITPIPLRVELDPRKVALGRRLFSDTRLSRDDTVSCASCHDLKLAGADGRPHAIGVAGKLGELNSPTVLNSGFNFRQFWDGRAASLEEQVRGPVHNPMEMATNWKEVIAKLERDPDYPRLFEALWPDGITGANIQSAIAEFERALITPNAPFDRFLRGDVRALSGEALKGWELFRNLGCVACHQGVNVGGNMYANLGVMGDYFAERGRPLRKSDLGRFNITGREEDRHLFKVPSLRNIDATMPYFHDGSIADLAEAVDTMARHQLGVTLKPGERAALVAFLKSLSGTLREPIP